MQNVKYFTGLTQIFFGENGTVVKWFLYLRVDLEGMGSRKRRTMENNVLVKYVVVLIVFMTLENCEYKKD